MYKIRFGINNLQWLMCHNTKLNQTKPNDDNHNILSASNINICGL